MSRPFSWFPLAGSDPVPGDPVVVRAAGDRYVQVADTIASTAARLRRLTETDGAVSEVVSAIREKATTVAEDIEKAKGRYDGVGHALQGYAAALDGAQAESEAALRDAQAAQQRVDAATSDIAAAQRRLDGLSADEDDDPARTRYRAQLARARNERDDAEVALAAARTRLDAAVTDRDRAAETAISAMQDVTSDGLDDGWWENWGSDVAHQVSEWCGNLAAGFGVASLLLGWIPVVGPALGIIAAGLGAVALVADLFIAFNEGGSEAWTNVALGAVGVLTFGAGQVIGRSARAFSASASSAMAQASQQASRSLFSRVGRAILRRPIPAAMNEPAIVAAATRGGSWAARTGSAWRQVRSLRGMDRVLALAGHGDLVTSNNALRAAFGQAFPWHPRACLTLLGPTVKGALIEGATAVQYAGDATLTVTSITKTGLNVLQTEQVPAEVLNL